MAEKLPLTFILTQGLWLAFYMFMRIFSILLLAQESRAFINIESLRQNREPGLSGMAKLQMNGQVGNTDKIIGNIESTTRGQFDENEVLNLIKYQYGETNGATDTNLGSFHLRYTKSLSEKISWEFYGQLEFNEFQKLNLRQLAGTGARMQLFKSTTNFCYFGSGAFYEKEDLEKLPSNENIRGNFYLSLMSQWQKTFQSSLILYYQPLSTWIKDFRIQVNAGLNFPLSDMFSINTELNISHDSQQALGVEPTDTSYMVGFNFSY